jgi:hypothetical protein
VKLTGYAGQHGTGHEIARQFTDALVRYYSGHCNPQVKGSNPFRPVLFFCLIFYVLPRYLSCIFTLGRTGTYGCNRKPSCVTADRPGAPVDGKDLHLCEWYLNIEWCGGSYYWWRDVGIKRCFNLMNVSKSLSFQNTRKIFVVLILKSNHIMNEYAET